MSNVIVIYGLNMPSDELIGKIRKTFSEHKTEIPEIIDTSKTSQLVQNGLKKEQERLTRLTKVAQDNLEKHTKQTKEVLINLQSAFDGIPEIRCIEFINGELLDKLSNPDYTRPKIRIITEFEDFNFHINLKESEPVENCSILLNNDRINFERFVEKLTSAIVKYRKGITIKSIF